MVGEASSDVQDPIANPTRRDTANGDGSSVAASQEDMDEGNPFPTITDDQKTRMTGQEDSGTATTDTSELLSFSIPKCEVPPSAVFEQVESFVAAAVEAQHIYSPAGGGPPLVDTYKGLIDTLRTKQDLEMMRFILLALRTSGKGRTLTYLTQSATKHAPLIHLVVRLNPFELLSPTMAATDNESRIKADYDMADAQLHLLMAIVSANSVFLVPTLNSLWKSLASSKTNDVPVEKTCRLHAALATLLRLVPKAKTELFPIIHANAPFRTRPVEELIWYYKQALRVVEYAPAIEADVIELAMDRSLEMDVEIKITDGGQASIDRDTDAENDETDVSTIFELDMDTTTAATTTATDSANVTVSEMANKLDAMMLLLFQHISRAGSYGKIFKKLVEVFNHSILITHKSKFVQYLLFYICGVGCNELVPVPVENGQVEDDNMDRIFVSNLIAVLYHPFKSVVTRQTGACYLASFVSRAEFCKPETVCQAVHALLRWTGAYMDAVKQTHASDARQQCALHSLFYTVAQAAFYCMCFRGREAWEYHQSQARERESAEDDIGAEKWERLCAHELNPLKNCLESVRVEFLKLADAFKLISDGLRQSILEERSASSTRPKRKRKALISTPATLEKERLKGGVGGLGQGSNPLDSFFPFDPYLLRQSHVFVEPYYRHWQDCAVANLPLGNGSGEQTNDQIVTESGDESNDDEDDDDNDKSEVSLVDHGMDDDDDDDEEEEDSGDEDTTSNQPMSFSSKFNGFDEASPLIRVELGGDFIKAVRRPRAPSIENGSW